MAVVDATVLVEVAGCSKLLLAPEDETGTNWDTARASSSAKWSAKFAVLRTADAEGSCEGREVLEKKLDTCEATLAAKFSMFAGVISPMGVGVA